VSFSSREIRYKGKVKKQTLPNTTPTPHLVNHFTDGINQLGQVLFHDEVFSFILNRSKHIPV
jgi:hypothetical protein